MKFKSLLFIITISALSFLLGACRADWQKWMHAQEEKSMTIQRYDRLLDEFVSLNSYSALQRMNTEYSQETILLIENVLSLGRVEDPNIDRKLREYFLDSTLQVILQDVHQEYSNLKSEEARLGKIFWTLKEEDPDFTIPLVYTQISALNQSIVVGDSILGISLDKYLGADYPLYTTYYYPCQRRSMRRERIVSDAASFYLYSEYWKPGDTASLLDRMVFVGKIHWIIAHILGDISLTDEIDFHGKRKKWCEENQEKAWKYIVDHGFLQTKDFMQTRTFMGPFPYTKGLSEESADQLGYWFGIHIADAFMKKYPDTTIRELLNMSSQEIYKKSEYKP